MVSRHKIRRQWPRLLVLFLILSLALVACERPLQDTGEAPSAEEVTEEELDQGGGVPADTEGGEAVEADEDATGDEGEAAATEPEAEETAEEGEMGEEEAETEEEEASPRPEDEAEDEGAAEEAVSEETGEDESAEAAEAAEEAAEAMEETTEPRTHVVQAGENLYRIGLQYGVSWVVLAEANNITNPNRIVVGQELIIPGEGDGDDTPTPTPPPDAETTYVVQPGDNLYRIGRMYNMSWVEIAEANGIVNPNRILVGQVLTIPGGTPAEVTHTVQPGETLFRISLQYGVDWQALATENNVNPPYVIYPGQVLTIPGG